MDVNSYIRKRSMNLSNTTLDSHKATLNRFKEICNLDNRQPTVDDVDEYIDYCMENDLYSRTSLKQNLSTIKMYFKVMRLDNQDELEELLRVRSPTISISDYEHKTYDKKDIINIIDNCTKPWNLFGAITYTYARRLKEVALLRTRDIGETSIRFKIVKTKDKTKKLSRDMLREEWNDWLSEVKEESTGKLFGDAWDGKKLKHWIPRKRLTQAARRAGVIRKGESISVHGLRHSRARHLIDQEGIDQRTLSDGLLFHEQLSTTTDTYGTKEDAEEDIPGV